MLGLPKRLKEKLLQKFISVEEFNEELLIEDDVSLTLQLLEMQGLSLTKTEEGYYSTVFEESLKKQIFCIVDIETNGSKKNRDQVIEIGAIKIQGKKILSSFDTLIKTDVLPEAIKKLTGITLEELENAPSLKSVMHDFRLFLGDAIFVAHALKFDYEFISAMFERAGMGPMLNPGLCTIDLAERTFSSAKYGLSYLNKTLHLENEFQQHRALNDALITEKIFRHSIKKLPRGVKNVKDLLRYSKESKRMPKAPLIEFSES